MAGHGVVLGGGGVVGVAWELGVLASLRDKGLHPLDDASVAVGTSAGSLVAAHIMAGVNIAELENSQREPLAGPATPPPEPDLALLGELFNTWTTAPEITEDLAREVCALALRCPTMAEEDLVTMLGSRLPSGDWPDRVLRVTTVACSTGARVVWSSDSEVDLRRAVAASCSVPGLFPPVTVDPTSPERYTDGGLWSPTNADLLLDSGVESAVIIESMSAVAGGMSSLSKRALEREITALERAGIHVAVVSPGPDYAELGPQLMDPARRGDGVRIGREDGAAAAPAVAEVAG